MIRAKFRLNTRAFAQGLDHLIVLVQQKVAFQLLESIVNMNPVLTGRSRGNWQVTLGSPAVGEVVSPSSSAQDTIGRGAATISAIATLGAIYLTNNVPYILELERGSSKQAPQGMVQVSLDRIGAQFR